MPEHASTTRIVTRELDADPAGLHLGTSALLARIYAARGIRSAEDLDLSLSGMLAPEGLDGADAAAALLADAVQMGKHIKIVGDFDADGATATAVAMLALDAMGATRVSFIVPNRFEFGYGLTPEIVKVSLQDDPDVLVTVDNGISSIAGVEAARQAGLEVIVTDHHLPGKELPAANAIVNPNLPESGFGSTALAGVGVIFYVMSLLRTVLRGRGWFDGREAPNLANYLDLVALGTVADVVPLDHNNRVLVHQGLRRIRAGRMRPGIRALCEVAGRSWSSLTAQDIGFAVAPRLNAAGRLDDMAIGIKCLLADDMAQAHSMAQALDQLNLARREIEQQMTADAQMIVAGMSEGDFGPEQLGICVFDESWHQGVVGIVAGRLKDRLHRPVIAFAAVGDTSAELKGSARSVAGVHVRDVLDAIASRFPGLISKFGGHAMAAGLSIRRLHYERFAKAFAEEVARWLTEDEVGGLILSDGELAEDDLTLDNALSIKDAGPWGQGFPEPLFHGDFEIVHQRVVGEKHTKLALKAGGRVVDAIAFNREPIRQGNRALVAYRLSENDYGPVSTLQLMVEHLEPATEPSG